MRPQSDDEQGINKLWHFVEIWNQSMQAISVCLNEWLTWMILIYEGKKIVKCFDLFWTTLLYINMKNHENIACTDFVNVNIALN